MSGDAAGAAAGGAAFDPAVYGDSGAAAAAAGEGTVGTEMGTGFSQQGGMSSLLQKMTDPVQGDALASKLATHFDPPSGEYDFTQQNQGPQPPSADPKNLSQLEGTSQPSAAGSGRGVGPEGVQGGPPQSGMTDAQKAKMAQALGGVGKMAGGLGRQAPPPQAPVGRGGGPGFSSLPPGLAGPAAGIPQAGMAPPTLPAGPNAMTPRMAAPGQQLPPSLAQLLGRG